MAVAPRITIDELRRRMEAGEDFTIIDVRDPAEWKKSDIMIPEARRVPLDRWEQSLATIPGDRPIVTYCT